MAFQHVAAATLKKIKKVNLGNEKNETKGTRVNGQYRACLSPSEPIASLSKREGGTWCRDQEEGQVGRI